MHTVVFMHGTGVREPAYTTSFNLVQQALNRRLGAPNVRVESCYWGGACGSELFLGGTSIPEFDTTRAIDREENDTEEYLLGLWAVLYEDAFAELDLLALRVLEEPPPGQELPGAELDQLVRKLTAEAAELRADERQELATLLDTAGITAYFNAACAFYFLSCRFRLAGGWPARNANATRRQGFRRTPYPG